MTDAVGFFAEIYLDNKSFSKKVQQNSSSYSSSDSMSDVNYYITKKDKKKFVKDQVFYKSDRFLLLIDGVILNSLELIKKYKADSLINAVLAMYMQNGEEFFREFRGTFSGLLFDKKKDVWLIFVDHFGSKRLFYSNIEGNRIVCGSQILPLIDYFKANGIRYSLDNNGAYSLLCCGFMLEDITLIKEVKKLLAGHYIRIRGGITEIKKYYKFDTKPMNSDSEKDIIENLDCLFKQAVQLEFDKDIEYECKHLVALSGGLDSRVVNFSAHSMGYNNITNFTFSQSGSVDAKVAQNISDVLNNEWLFKSLGKGNFLLNSIDDMVISNSATTIFAGAAHTKNFIDLVDISKFGLFHNGSLGDLVVGGSFNEVRERKEFIVSCSYSKRISIANKININLDKYDNYLEFATLNRAINAGLHGEMLCQHKSESISPFLYVDFADYALRIPYRHKIHHKIYFKWIKHKYVNATKHKSTRFACAKIPSIGFNLLGRHLYIRELPIKVVKRFLISDKLKSKESMNPFDYWYRVNVELEKYISDYYNENLSLLADYKEIQADCRELFLSGDFIEKSLVLTLLGGIKLFFA